MTEDRDPGYLAGLFSLAGKVAVVTGAGHGIGRAIASGLSRAGARVAAVDIDVSSVRETVGAIERGGREALALVHDLGSESEIESLFAAVEASFGPTDVLVNNAAINAVMAVPEQYPLEAWERTLQINLTAPFLCARSAARQMIAAGRGGSIVNLSSINGSRASARGSLSYDVSKGGVNHLTRCLAAEWGKHGIRVNAVQPCQFNPGWDDRLADPEYRDLACTVLRGIPLGRFGEPKELVGPTIFLASDAASMVTGVCLPVDGGNLALNAGAGGAWPATHYETGGEQ